MQHYHIQALFKHDDGSPDEVGTGIQAFSSLADADAGIKEYWEIMVDKIGLYKLEPGWVCRYLDQTFNAHRFVMDDGEGFLFVSPCQKITCIN